VKPRALHAVIRLLIAALLLIVASRAALAQSDPAAVLLARLNALRVQNGLLPLAVSPLLTAAAQRHAADMARTGNVTHTGSDGSSIESRIRDTGYGFWRTFGIVGENIYGGQTAVLDDAWNFWTTSAAHRSNLLSTRYREMGAAVVTTDLGSYYTIDFGAQPNVLPFFVSGTPQALSLLLTNEDNITTGDGVAVMGRAVEARAGEGTDLRNVPWQPWAQTITLPLADGPTVRTISVEYRDELGRGTIVTQQVNLANLSPAGTPTPTVTSAPTTTLPPTPRATDTPTAMPSPTATTAPTALPSASPTVEATSTPQPTDTPTATATSTMPPATLIPEIIQLPTATARVIAAALPTSVSASRLTPPAPRPAPTDRPIIASYTSAPVDVLLGLLGLQVVALAIGGVIVVVRMRRKS
jgi:hypothetical protein